MRCGSAPFWTSGRGAYPSTNVQVFQLKAVSSRKHPRDYTHKIEYLRHLAELARHSPMQMLPPERHVLLMRPNTPPYEFLGRCFVVYLARVNVCLANGSRHGLCLYEMSNLAAGFRALPKGLRYRMLSELADYIVSDFLVWVRGESLCALLGPHSFFKRKTFVIFSSRTSCYISGYR